MLGAFSGNGRFYRHYGFGYKRELRELRGSAGQGSRELPRDGSAQFARAFRGATYAGELTYALSFCSTRCTGGGTARQSLPRGKSLKTVTNVDKLPTSDYYL
jgi:hypothetical protein